MARYTKNNLISDLNELNEKLKAAGSPYSYSYESRCGYHAVDLYKKEEGREAVCVSTIDCYELPTILFNRALADSIYRISEAKREAKK